MRPLLTVAMLAGLLMLGACQREAEPTPAPFAMTEDAMGRYCGMNILEHSGPKGQIILAKYDEPIWFSSARDTIAFTMLPEEPKDIRAIYVSDMAKAPNWDQPGADNWVDARQAFFVIGSNAKGGMGTTEAVPFSSEEAATALPANMAARSCASTRFRATTFWNSSRKRCACAFRGGSLT